MTEDRLRKVLELERQKRFNDRAVTAGLDTFLRNITTHESSQLGSDVFARIQQLPVAGYRSLTPALRKRWLEGVLGALKDDARPEGRGGGVQAAERRRERSEAEGDSTAPNGVVAEEDRRAEGAAAATGTRPGTVLAGRAGGAGG